MSGSCMNDAPEVFLRHEIIQRYGAGDRREKSVRRLLVMAQRTEQGLHLGGRRLQVASWLVKWYIGRTRSLRAAS